MAMYESDHTRWMREWMEKHPEEFEEQKKGRALWWDKAPQSLDEMQRARVAKVPTKSYYYDAN